MHNFYSFVPVPKNGPKFAAFDDTDTRLVTVISMEKNWKIHSKGSKQ